MEFISKAQAKRLTGLTYLGSVSKTVKHRKSLKYGELTYSLYLAPGNTSGYEVCPGRNEECSRLCLNESGMNTMVRNDRGDVINECRIRKTKLFFEHHEFFMAWLIFEIAAAKRKADRIGYKFSVRLNNTSDISPIPFQPHMGPYKNKNILEIFPDVQFYDYTKIPSRVNIMRKYPNYDVTISYNGYNMDICKQMLADGVRVAMVFLNKIPDTYMGYKVVNGDDYDMRYRDTEPTIVGLKYKRVRNKLTPNIKFVIR